MGREMRSNVYSTPVPTALSTVSILIFLTLVVTLITSSWIFYRLTQQWTTDRPGQALREWAGEHEFKMQPPTPGNMPDALNGLNNLDPQIEIILQRGSTILIKLTTSARPTLPRPVWHLLIQGSKRAWKPAGLRPVGSASSFLDLFSLDGFPSLLPPERFVAMGVTDRDARLIVGTPARGLMPADIGLLVHGPHVTLDFSSRPFDTIEFDRMIAIMEQVIRF